MRNQTSGIGRKRGDALRPADARFHAIRTQGAGDESTIVVTSGPQRAADARWAAGARRLGLMLALGWLVGCAAHGPRRLESSSIGARLRMAGDFAGVVSLDGGIVTVQLERARVRYNGWAEGDTASVEDVTLRAIVATDSAGVGIPLGVSGALEVAPVMSVGADVTMDGRTFAIPLPPDRRARDLWIAFQFRGTVRARRTAPELLIAYTCSEMNLFGVSKSANARARRMRASYTVGCSL